jgi:hypothetical protein
MTMMQIERRLAPLEKDKAKLKAGSASKKLWWNDIAGAFADDPLFEQAVRYGRQWRDPLDRKSPGRRARGHSRQKAGR